jgi:hypothetical protein
MHLLGHFLVNACMAPFGHLFFGFPIVVRRCRRGTATLSSTSETPLSSIRWIQVSHWKELTVWDAVDQDRVFKYQESIRGAGSSLLAGKYVTIGGRPMDWAMAGLKRTIGLSLFPRDRELFWVRFPASAGALQKLSEMCDEGRLRPVIGAEVLLQDGPVRNAFASLHARRTVGKLVIKSPQ